MDHSYQMQTHGIILRLQTIINDGIQRSRRQVEAKRKAETEEQLREKRFKREFGELRMKAVGGMRNLLKAHRAKEMQTMFRLLRELNRHELTVAESEKEYGEGMDSETTSFVVKMTSEGVSVFVRQETDENFYHDFLFYNLDQIPTRGNVGFLTAVDEFVQEVPIPNRQPEYEWLVCATHACDKAQHVPESGKAALPEYERMAWLAFLVACADEEKLAKFMEQAFKKLEI